MIRKKVIFFIGSLDIGGAERHIVTIAPLLVQRGLSVEVVTLSRKGLQSPVLEAQGVEVTCLNTPFQTKIMQCLPGGIRFIIQTILHVTQISRKFRQEEAAFVHFFLPEVYMLGMIGAALANFKGVRILSRRSMNEYQKKRPFLGFLERKLHSWIDAATGNSLCVVKQLNEEGIQEENIYHIYNGIQTSVFSQKNRRENVRQNLKIGLTDLVLIQVANLIPYKGHLDLLHALVQIKDKMPVGWRLLCAGGNSRGILSSLKVETEALGLGEHILWLGSRNDVADLLMSSDIAILASHEEGFSNAILEAMGASLPLVVTNVGGNAEAVVDGKTGYVVPARDITALSDAILKLANDSERAKQLGVNGNKRLYEKFSLEECVNGYVALYNNLNHQK